MEAERKPVCVVVTVAEVENGGGGHEVLPALGKNGVRLWLIPRRGQDLSRQGELTNPSAGDYDWSSAKDAAAGPW